MRRRLYNSLFWPAATAYEAAGGIHNALHMPVVAYNAPIVDRAAVEFARGFYRSRRRDRDVSQAVDRAREALAVLFPSEAGGKVRLINGDMVTPGTFAACMGRIDERLDRMDAYPRRWRYVGLLLLNINVRLPLAAEDSKAGQGPNHSSAGYLAGSARLGVECLFDKLRACF